MREAAEHRITTMGLEDRVAYTLESPDGRCLATIVPDLAMLCWSLTLDDEEYLGRPNSLAAFARDWATTGIPLVHPWANRLGGDRIVGVAEATIPPTSRLVPRDERGLAIHGLNLADAGWVVQEASADDRSARVRAQMAFTDPERLAIFPFVHDLAVTMTLVGHTLTITTSVTNRSGRPMPISFGWHPYLRLPAVPRRDWRVSLPVATQAELDERMLPTGREHPVVIAPGALGNRTYDDLFPRLSDPPVFSVSGAGREVQVAFHDGYPLGQVYAPRTADVIAFEPMTAPTNALITGSGLRWIASRATFDADFGLRFPNSISIRG